MGEGGQTHRTYTQDELLRMAPFEFEALRSTASGRDAIARAGGNPHPHGSGCACSECFIEMADRSAPRSTAREVVDGYMPATPVDEGLRRVAVESDLGRNTDNWKHRSQDMKCATCMYFVEKTPEPQRQVYADGRPDLVTQAEASVGRCRRRAPTLNGWPAMKLTDWCGDHKIDEEKI